MTTKKGVQLNDIETYSLISNEIKGILNEWICYGIPKQRTSLELSIA
jgi:hypothetical protein